MSYIYKNITEIKDIPGYEQQTGHILRIDGEESSSYDFRRQIKVWGFPNIEEGVERFNKSREEYGDKKIDLKYIYLRNFTLQSFPQQICHITNLKELRLNNLGMEDDLMECLCDLTHLEVLSLTHNKLTGLPSRIGKLEKLRMLDLIHNLITVFPNSLYNLTNLEKLFFKDNKLTSLSKDIGNLKKLEELDCAENELTELPDSIGKLDNLIELHCAGYVRDGVRNGLTKLPDSIGSLVKLRYLYCEKNMLENLPDSICSLDKLALLYCDENMLEKLPDNIGNLGNLRALYCGSNRLVELPDSICRLDKLVKLYCGKNMLEKLPDNIGNLGKLRILSCESNQLTELPDSIENLKKLEHLIVEDNTGLVRLPEFISNNTTNRQTLHVHISETGFFLRQTPNADIRHGQHIEFLPPMRQTLLPQVRPHYDSSEVHKAAANIQYEKLVVFLKNLIKVEVNVRSIRFSKYINESISEIINECYLPQNNDETPLPPPPRVSTEKMPPPPPVSTEKQALMQGFNNIMSQRLNEVEYQHQPEHILETIYYTLEYVKRQPCGFKQPYVTSFVQDCNTAYGDGTMTCAAGALERIILSLNFACSTYISNNPNEEYSDILTLLVKPNPNDVIRDWYIEHKNCEGFPKNVTTSEDRRNSLIQHLMEKQLPEIDNVKTAEKHISGLSFDCDDFAYEGGRKTRKNQNKRKNRKTKKSTNKKTRKQPKRNLKKSRRILKR